jgi:hypothetical protein
MKAYTDLEQSRKLAVFLPLESADMVWISIEDDESFDGAYEVLPKGCSLVAIDDNAIPCWSLAALMDVLDRGALFKTPKGWACQTYVEYKAINSNYHSNPVDACVEMILELHKQKDK